MQLLSILLACATQALAMNIYRVNEATTTTSVAPSATPHYDPMAWWGSDDEEGDEATSNRKPFERPGSLFIPKEKYEDPSDEGAPGRGFKGLFN